MTGPGAMADLSWLLDNFADQLRGIAHVVVVSADGLLLATSRDLPPDRAEQLAAITAGLVSLAYGTSRYFDGGDVQQTIVEMGAGYLILMSIVGYEMALLVERVGKALNPLPRDSYAH
jgi:predicted regulator of Ras-like GTPase activity (Roadblock/LC7/MglB family)